MPDRHPARARPTPLATFIESERTRRAWTRPELAAKINKASGPDRLTCSYKSVESWEREGHPPRPAALRALAVVFERPVEELVTLSRRASAAPPVLVNAAGLESLASATDHEYASGVRDTIRTLVGLEVRHGGNEAGPLASRCLEAARRRLGQGGSGAEVVAAVAELAEVAGWLLHDADRQSHARHAMHEALHLARLAGDRDMELFTLGLLAFVEIWDGRPGTALMIARSALGQELTSRQVAMFAIREGRALAALGDRGALRSMDLARSALQDGVAGDEPDWAWWLDDAELIHHVGRVHAALGEHREALELLHQANELCPPSRISGLYGYRANTLECAVDAGDWATCEALTSTLRPDAGIIGSGRTETVIRRSTVALAASSANPSVQDAARSLRETLDAG